MATLLLNGKTVTVDAAPDTPLLWVLRDHLQLTGTKFGCGASFCGACTVHIDGVATRSCVTLLSTLAGKKITSSSATVRVSAFFSGGGGTSRWLVA